MRGPVLLVVAFLLALPATEVIRRFALSRQLIDRPNSRSSHTEPTPRGGGLAFVGVFLSLLVIVAQQEDGGRLALALGVGGLLIAAIGFVDDVRSLSARLRAAVHAAAALSAVLLLGLPTVSGAAGAALGALLVLGLVWLINLYNFMDGIDGLAGGQAVVGSLGLVALATAAPAVDTAAWVLAGAVAGFLVLNAPPARIFMGDVGSGFLGFVLGVLALAAHAAGTAPAAVLVLPLAPFLVDASATLAVRVLRRQRWYEAHRDHVYQRLTRAGMSHRSVTACYLLLAVLLLGAAVVIREWQSATAVAALLLLSVLAGWAVARHRTDGGVASAG